MRSSEFDVYQTEAGYVAVTNEVRRKILNALAKKERELGELVKVTGKAKSTLSNLHVRELLGQHLVEELPHPTDARRKVYRLAGQRIGSSSIPVEQLRGAVKHYVSMSPLAHAVPLQQMLDVLLAAGPKATDAIVKQGVKLGEIASQLLTAPDLRDLVQRVAAYWEREGVTRTASIHLDELALDVDVNPRYGESKEQIKIAGVLLAAFMQGVLRRHDASRSVAPEALAGQRVRIRVM